MPKKSSDPITDHQRVLARPQVIPERKALEYDLNQKRRDWLDPIGMSQLKRAVEQRKKTAIIHGIEYAITYKIYFPSMILDKGNETECVKLKRTDGMRTPFGYVAMRRILKFEFEEGKG